MTEQRRLSMILITKTELKGFIIKPRIVTHIKLIILNHVQKWSLCFNSSYTGRFVSSFVTKFKLTIGNFFIVLNSANLRVRIFTNNIKLLRS